MHSDCGNRGSVFYIVKFAKFPSHTGCKGGYTVRERAKGQTSLHLSGGGHVQAYSGLGTRPPCHIGEHCVRAQEVKELLCV